MSTPSPALAFPAQSAPASPVISDRAPAVLGLVIFAIAIASEYRIRMGASATVAELGAYLAALLLLVVPADAPSSRTFPRDAAMLGALLLWVTSRAFAFRIFRMPDVESAFSHVRDVCVPPALVVLVRWRVRLSERARERVALALVGSGVLCGAVGVSQFFTGWPYVYDGIDIVRYKTMYAQKYWIAEVLNMKVDYLARGFYGFSISYAAALVVPTVTAFALAWSSRGRRRVLWGVACFICYAGIYLSFTRSVLAIVPFGCFLAVRAVAGRLRPLTCAAMVTGYVLVALVAPLLHLRSVSDSDIDTLNSRVATLTALWQHVSRDPSVLLTGGTVLGWREWNSLAPHNWAANALLYDGLPGALLRVGCWLSLFGSLYPVRRHGVPADPLAAGLWAGSFTLLFVVGETEPFTGISLYLVAACGLALRAAIDDGERASPATAT